LLAESGPNNPVELAVHSAGFLEVRGVIAGGPQLTGSDVVIVKVIEKESVGE
jgi:hypothetical protein